MALTHADARVFGRQGGIQAAANASPQELQARARRAFEGRMARFEAEADPEGRLPTHVRRRAAERRLRAEMAKRSLQARRKAISRRAELPELGRPLRHQWPVGEANPACKHPDETVRRALELLAAGWTTRRVGEALGADFSTVARWRRGESRASAREVVR